MNGEDVTLRRFRFHIVLRGRRRKVDAERKPVRGKVEVPVQWRSAVHVDAAKTFLQERRR